MLINAIQAIIIICWNSVPSEPGYGIKEGTHCLLIKVDLSNKPLALVPLLKLVLQ
jgi:hypothetical protein